MSIARKYATQQQIPRSLPKSSRSPPAGGYTAPKRPPSHQERAVLNSFAKIQLIEQLFASGTRLLYKAPKRLAIFRLQNWLLSAVCIGGVLTYQKVGLLDLEEYQKRRQSRIIYFLYMIIAGFLCGIAGFLVYRTRGHVHAISLVERSNQIYLNVTTRSAVPFLKGNVLAKPENLVIRNSLVLPQGMPQVAPKNTGGQPSVMKTVLKSTGGIGEAFVSATRLFFTNEGMIDLEILEQQATKEETSSAYSLDVTGGWEVKKDGGDPVLFDIARVEERPAKLGLFSLFMR